MVAGFEDLGGTRFEGGGESLWGQFFRWSPLILFTGDLGERFGVDVEDL